MLVLAESIAATVHCSGKASLSSLVTQRCRQGQGQRASWATRYPGSRAERPFSAGSGRRRQVELERRATVLMVVGADAPAVSFDDGAGDGQPQARPRLPRARRAARPGAVGPVE